MGLILNIYYHIQKVVHFEKSYLELIDLSRLRDSFWETSKAEFVFDCYVHVCNLPNDDWRDLNNFLHYSFSSSIPEKVE